MIAFSYPADAYEVLEIPQSALALLTGMRVCMCRCCGASLPHSAPLVRVVHRLCEVCSSLEDSEFNSEVPLAGEGPESIFVDALAHRLRGTKRV